MGHGRNAPELTKWREWAALLTRPGCTPSVGRTAWRRDPVFGLPWRRKCTRRYPTLSSCIQASSYRQRCRRRRTIGRAWHAEHTCPHLSPTIHHHMCIIRSRTSVAPLGKLLNPSPRAAKRRLRKRDWAALTCRLPFRVPGRRGSQSSSRPRRPASLRAWRCSCQEDLAPTEQAGEKAPTALACSLRSAEAWALRTEHG